MSQQFNSSLIQNMSKLPRLELYVIVITWSPWFLLFQQGRLMTYFPKYRDEGYLVLNVPHQYIHEGRLELNFHKRFTHNKTKTINLITHNFQWLYCFTYLY